MNTDRFTCQRVDADNWRDLEMLFESRGGPHNCWCMVWRKMDQQRNRSTKSDKKNALQKYVDDQTPIGILCYNGREPIAWCSVAPRESYRNLSGDNALDKVWSLVCFFIKKEYRQQGLSERLVVEGMKYARRNGANYLEAYPVDPGSPSYRFMGYKPLFEKLGFEFKRKAGKRRNVMVIKL